MATNNEVEFLQRLFNLESLPSYDGRFKNAAGDIWQHRVNSPTDWRDDWVYDDASRFSSGVGRKRARSEFSISFSETGRDRLRRRRGVPVARRMCGWSSKAPIATSPIRLAKTGRRGGHFSDGPFSGNVTDPMKVMIIDRGAGEIVYPADWSAELVPEGHMRLVDPTDSCSLEISLLPFRLSQKAELPVDQLLRETLSTDGRESGEVHLDARGDLRVAWSDASYECDDVERGQRRVAHCRYLLGSNGLFTVLLSFNYWHDDVDWAVPAWQRIAASLQLGDGARLAGPEEHWSLRKPN